MSNLDSELETLTQRTGTTFDLSDGKSRQRFLNALVTDIASIMHQLNIVYKPIVESLEATSVLDIGLSGTNIYTDIEALETTGDLYYDASLSRARTIKESFDYLLTLIANLQTAVISSTEVDWTSTADALQASIDAILLNISQIKEDAFPDSYTLDGDGNKDLAYPLAQHIDAIGAFFTNFPTINGGTYSVSYPSLTLAVNLSDIVIDGELAQSVITDLVTDLDSIRDFIGMDTIGPESPTYSDHGTLIHVADGDTLESAIQTLDSAIGELSLVVDTFPGDSSALTEQAKSYSVLLLTEYPQTALTKDGEAPTISNSILVPPHTALFIEVHWVGYTDDSSGGGIGGTSSCLAVNKLSGLSVVASSAGEMKSVTPTNDIISMVVDLTGPSTSYGTGAVITFHADTPATNYLEIRTNFGGFGVETRWVATCHVTQVRWNA